MDPGDRGPRPKSPNKARRAARPPTGPPRRRSTEAPSHSDRAHSGIARIRWGSRPGGGCERLPRLHRHAELQWDMAAEHRPPAWSRREGVRAVEDCPRRGDLRGSVSSPAAGGGVGQRLRRRRTLRRGRQLALAARRRNPQRMAGPDFKLAARTSGAGRMLPVLRDRVALGRRPECVLPSGLGFRGRPIPAATGLARGPRPQPHGVDRRLAGGRPGGTRQTGPLAQPVFRLGLWAGSRAGIAVTARRGGGR
jgi:hypothetical protein